MYAPRVMLCLLKKGAFFLMKPVKIMGIRYLSTHITPCCNGIYVNYFTVLMLCCWGYRAEIFEFPDYYPNHLNLKEG